MKLRVLHVSSGNLYGGVETALVTLARFRHLCPEMDQQFALCFEGRLSEELREAGVPVHRLNEVRASRPWTVRAARQRLRQVISEQKPDVVICHMFWSLAVFGPAARKASAPLLFWAHDTSTGSRWLEQWARRASPDAIIGNSLYTQTTVSKFFPETPWHVLRYPVSQARSEEAAAHRPATRKELGVGNGTVVVLQVSRMEAWKGHLLHLEALSRIKDMPGWTCWIAGGPQRPEEEQYLGSLRKKAVELGIADRVQFLGQRSDVRTLLAAADIFCQPNQGPEPFGIVFIEALYAGLPLLTTAMGGPPEIIDDSCGILVEPGQPAQIAEALRRLIESPGLRDRLRQAGPSRARQLCDPGAQIHRLKDVAEQAARKVAVCA